MSRLARLLLPSPAPALAIALALLLALGAPAPATAKEHAAACSEIPGFIVRVRATLEVAMYQRHRGSSLGAFQVLRSTSASLVRDAARGGCGALGGAFSTALRRAGAAHTALEASVELDLGLETGLALAFNGRPPPPSSPPKLPQVPEARVWGAGCPDLYPIVLRLDGPADNLPARVKTVVSDLRAHPRCEGLRALLEGTGPDRLGHAVDSVLLDEPDPSRDGDDGNPMSRCPEYPLVYERLASAIAVGAPRFNAGDADGCRQTYEETSRALTREVIGAERCPVVRDLLTAGLSGAAGARNPSDAAWALRRSFDAILAAPGDAAGEAGTGSERSGPAP